MARDLVIMVKESTVYRRTHKHLLVTGRFAMARDLVIMVKEFTF